MVLHFVDDSRFSIFYINFPIKFWYLSVISYQIFTALKNQRGDPWKSKNFLLRGLRKSLEGVRSLLKPSSGFFINKKLKFKIVYTAKYRISEVPYFLAMGSSSFLLYFLAIFSSPVLQVAMLCCFASCVASCKKLCCKLCCKLPVLQVAKLIYRQTQTVSKL